jgi:hypothetical protein
VTLGTRLLPSGAASFLVLYPLIGLFNGQDGDGNYAIGYAASNDGQTWTEAGSPVFSAGAGGQWDDDHVKDPWLMHDGSQYVMYYSGFDGTAYRIGRATATDPAGTWTRYVSNPVIDLGAGGAFDDTNVIFPVVMYEPSDTGREWKMWYTGFDGARWHIGYAYSSDGLSFTKHGQVLTVGAGGTWEDEGVVSAAIIKEGATYSLFYGGTSDPNGDFGWQGGYTTFTDPEGTYTKAAANPVLLNVNGVDPDASETLDANVSAGTTTITPSDTSHYPVGSTIVIGDTTSETEVHTVVSVESGTSMTVATATVSAFTTADSARVRPIDYLSVQPRMVRAVASGYEMFATAFQPIADLSFNAGITKLREASLRYTASSLDGPWTRDDTAGLLFPLYPATTGWHQFAAENLSVIVPP